jgi:hypothetical protein
MINYFKKLTKQQEAIRTTLVDCFPHLPIHFYPYAIYKYDKKHLVGFFKFFNDWWSLHQMFYPYDLNDEGFFYNMIEKKYADYITAMDIDFLQQQSKVAFDADLLDECIDEFWDEFRSK